MCTTITLTLSSPPCSLASDTRLSALICGSADWVNIFCDFRIRNHARQTICAQKYYVTLR